ncbi:MAG: hypothetical protein JWN37_86 [Candidatus Nomurabacteria bacterium]|nr:hypothetical protein [Candidatus Nomurabacteria bacterium]
MEFPKELSLKGEKYVHVDTQRGGDSAIYISGLKYLRIGDQEKVQKNLVIHKKLESFGFPVPKLIEEGKIDGMEFYIEESLGEKHFGLIFRDEVTLNGVISDDTFDNYIKVCVRFTEAQLKTCTNNKKWYAFTKAIHLDLLCEELPEYKEKILEAYTQVQRKLERIPFVICHGDFGPFNIYPNGVIDFEDSFSGPLGYDIGGMIEHLNWFPESSEYEFYRLYNFTPEQKSLLTGRIDEVYQMNNLPKLSDNLSEFNLLRGMWFAVRMGSYPKLQEFRHNLIKNIIDTI